MTTVGSEKMQKVIENILLTYCKGTVTIRQLFNFTGDTDTDRKPKIRTKGRIKATEMKKQQQQNIVTGYAR